MPASYLVLDYEETPRYEDAPATTPYRVSTVHHYFPIIAGRVAGEPQYRNRDNELRGNLSPTAQIVETFAPAGSVTVASYMSAAIPLFGLCGMTMTPTEGDGVNEVQSLTKQGTISGGTWILTVTAALVVSAIHWDATAAELQVLVDNRIRRGGTGFQLDDLVIAGGPIASAPFTITFCGTKSCTNVAAVTVDTGNLTGAGAGITVATDTPGSVGTVTMPDGTGLPGDAYRWVATKSSATTPQSAQLTAVYAENQVYEKGQGFAVSQLSMGADANVVAALTGLVSLPADDPGLTPSYDATSVYPMMQRDLVVTWRDNASNPAEFTWQIANPFQALRNYGVRSAYPGILRFTEGFVAMTGTVTLDTYAEGDRQAHYEGETFAVNATWKSRSQIGSTGALYQMFVQMPACQITGGTGPEDLAAKRNFQSSYNWGSFYDADSGYDFVATFSSGLSALSAYA